jgi:type II secretory pathway component GspD/PulD (secretin)
VAKLLEQLGGASPGGSETAVPRRIRALAGSGQLKILNRAEVTTLDSQPAYIHVGRRIPVTRSTATTAAGGRTMSVSYEDTGVIVGITPRISRGGRVAMEINVEKSGLGSAVPGGGGYEQMPNPPTARFPGGPPGPPDPGNVPRPPQNESIRLQTTVNLADGESTVIGGLAVESQPRQSKLVIMVTPHVIPPKD